VEEVVKEMEKDKSRYRDEKDYVQSRAVEETIENIRKETRILPLDRIKQAGQAIGFFVAVATFVMELLKLFQS
jgi:hypothetical protein